MFSELYHHKLFLALNSHLPKHAVPYCFELWKEYQFIFKIRNPRLTKAGDYTYNPKKDLHTITVNKNLNKYNFLITYIHEVAHQVAFVKYGRKIAPHGQEWKTTFAELMAPMLIPEIFPPDILKVALRHFKNPKASSAGDPALVKALKYYDPVMQKEDVFLLDEIPLGGYFKFRSKTYQKLEKRRTRILCEAHDKRRYLISKAAVVHLL